MKTCEQNRNNKRREIERIDWFVERIQTRVAFGFDPRFDLFIDWLIKQITNTYRRHFLRSYENRSKAYMFLSAILTAATDS